MLSAQEAPMTSRMRLRMLSGMAMGVPVASLGDLVEGMEGVHNHNMSLMRQWEWFMVGRGRRLGG